MMWISPILFAFSIVIALVNTSETCTQCSSDQPKTVAPHKNIWSGLTEEEIESVAKFMRQKFNLTSALGGSRDNTIFQIEFLQPNKTDVLPFLEGIVKAPKRYARAAIVFGASEEPYYEEYVVGPLPLSNLSKVQTLTYPFNNETPGRTKVPPAFLGTELLEYVTELGSEITDITKALWNSSIEEGISIRIATPFWEEDNKTIGWMSFINAPTSGFDSPTLLPLDLFVRFDLTGRDKSSWNVTGWYYNSTFYATTDELRAVINAPGFQPLPMNVDGNWTSTDPQGEAKPFDELPPPIAVSEGSKRFTVDHEEQYVSWMDFSFYTTLNRDTGLALFDIQYKGERLLYELGLQEALTHYAGSDPVQSGTTYYDTLGGFGAQIVPLVNGYDCPSYATYLNTSWAEGETIKVQPNSICIFEKETDFPLRRHTSRGFNYTSVTKNVALTARSVFSVGNYDFLLSYTFQLDGSIEILVRASGYIQSAYFAGNEEYGFKVHDNLSGSMHDHVLNFKADFDILGTKNSIQKVEFIPATVEYPWAKGKPRNTMKARKSFINNEADSTLNWAPNDAAIYAIVNKDAPNRFGEYRGYRIRPAGTIHLTVKDSSNVVNTGHFATHDLYITKRKDTEPRSAHGNNLFNPSDPLIDFSKFFNNESLDQEDLVVWFNLGMHHMPHTGDLPNTVFTLAHSSVMLEPLNYFENNPSSATRQQVRINYEDGVAKEAKTFEVRPANCSIDLGELTPTLENVFPG